MLFIPRRKVIEMKKNIVKETVENYRKMNEETFKNYSKNE